MPAFKQIPRYSASAWEWFRRGGHVHEWKAERFLQELSDYRDQWVAAKGAGGLPIGWLLPFREDLRRLLGDDVAGSVQRFLLHGDPQLRHLSVSLVSRFATRFQLGGIPDHMDDDSPIVRKHVAKALWHLEAWSLLGDMARAYPQDRSVQWFAHAGVSRRPFSARLQRYAQCVDPAHAAEATGGSRMPLWMRYGHWYGKPAKSAPSIRRLLLRIRRWVHGAAR